MEPNILLGNYLRPPKYDRGCSTQSLNMSSKIGAARGWRKEISGVAKMHARVTRFVTTVLAREGHDTEGKRRQDRLREQVGIALH